jgi:hypothetical protein
MQEIITMSDTGFGSYGAREKRKQNKDRRHTGALVLIGTYLATHYADSERVEQPVVAAPGTAGPNVTIVLYEREALYDLMQKAGVDMSSWRAKKLQRRPVFEDEHIGRETFVRELKEAGLFEIVHAYCQNH